MKKIFGSFWILFFLYFIFAHPAIIYYSSPNYTDLNQVDPSTSLIYLTLLVVLWLGILFFLLWLIIKYSFISKRKINQLLEKGKRIQAEIIEVKDLFKNVKNTQSKSLILEFYNFQKEKVWYKLDVNDSKPEQNRFFVGNTLFLRVDDQFKSKPYVVLEGTQTKINAILFIVWLIFIGAVFYGFNYVYDLENAGFGWRFLTFSHPLFISAFCLIGFPLIIYLFLKYLVFKKLNIGKKVDELRFNGIRANSQILKVSQTGTYINEQPEVKFDLKYFTKKGEEKTTSIKQIVSLLDVGQIKANDELMIFYDPNDLDKVMFEKDINAID